MGQAKQTLKFSVAVMSNPFPLHFFSCKSTHASEAGTWEADNISFLFGEGMNKESEGKNNSQYSRKIHK